MVYKYRFIFKTENYVDYYAGIALLLELSRTGLYKNTYFGPLDDQLIKKTGLMVYGHDNDTILLAFAFMQLAVEKELTLRRIHA